MLLNQLYALPLKTYSEADLNKIIADILKEENATYKTYCELLTKMVMSSKMVGNLPKNDINFAMKLKRK